LEKNSRGQAWWKIPVISTILEAEIGGLQFKASLGDPISTSLMWWIVSVIPGKQEA
jgi:hypothetical protein